MRHLTQHLSTWTALLALASALGVAACDSPSPEEQIALAAVAGAALADDEPKKAP
jgi:hypothetical protein